MAKLKQKPIVVICYSNHMFNRMLEQAGYIVLNCDDAMEVINVSTRKGARPSGIIIASDLPQGDISSLAGTVKVERGNIISVGEWLYCQIRRRVSLSIPIIMFVKTQAEHERFLQNSDNRFFVQKSDIVRTDRLIAMIGRIVYPKDPFRRNFHKH